MNRRNILKFVLAIFILPCGILIRKLYWIKNPSLSLEGFYCVTKLENARESCKIYCKETWKIHSIFDSDSLKAVRTCNPIRIVQYRALDDDGTIRVLPDSVLPGQFVLCYNVEDPYDTFWITT